MAEAVTQVQGPPRPVDAPFASLRDALNAGRPLRIMVLNDVGFIGGAGVATRRQVQSFLHGGHRVKLLCCLDNPEPRAPELARRTYCGQWEGIESLPQLNRSENLTLSEQQVVAEVASIVARWQPDVVIAGNLHWTGWPLALLSRIHNHIAPVIAYLHDCHWLTGRCVYFGGCEKYRAGCDAQCPTPTEYPALPPDLVKPAWQHRRDVFTRSGGIPLAANSTWMSRVATDAFADQARVETLHLGLDHQLFSPVNRRLARRLLKIPDNARVVLFAAVNAAEERKGGPLLAPLCRALLAQPNLIAMGFGHNTQYIPNLHGLGHIPDDRLLPVIYSAVDIMVCLSKEEAFGQTLMEAAACGIPLIAHDTGGVGDIARQNENAVIVNDWSVDAFATRCVDTLRDSPKLADMSRHGIALVESHYTIEHQYDRWHQYFSQLASEPPALTGQGGKGGVA